MLTFGVEIEFILPDTTQEYVAEALDNAGVACFAAGYNHQTSTSWKVVRDGSVNSGHELVSPVLTENRFSEIDAACAVLSRLGASVNRSCGLHVHVGARGLTVNAHKRLAALYAESEDVIDQLIPPSRRGSNNSYCASTKNVNVRALAAARDVTAIAHAVSNNDRRSKLNFTAFWRHGTVEFRQHSSTIDATKIKNWVLFCLKMVETAVREEGEALEVAPARPATSPPPTRAALATNPYWRRGRRTRTIFSLLSRPEGATAEEVRVALGVRSRPDIGWHVARARESGTVNHQISYARSRGGEVWRLTGGVERASVPVAPLPPPPPADPQLRPIATLAELMAKLQMTPTERTYWVERQAMLSPNRE